MKNLFDYEDIDKDITQFNTSTFDFINTPRYKIHSSIFKDPLGFLFEHVKPLLPGFNARLFYNYLDDYFENVDVNTGKYKYASRTKQDMDDHIFICVVTSTDSYIFRLVDFEYAKTRQQVDLSTAKFVFLYELDLMTRCITKVDINRFYKFLIDFKRVDIPYAGEIIPELVGPTDNFEEFCRGTAEKYEQYPTICIYLKRNKDEPYINLIGKNMVMASPDKIIKQIKFELWKMKAKNKSWPATFGYYINDCLYTDPDNIENKETRDIIKELQEYFWKHCEIYKGYVSDYSNCEWDDLNKIVNKE